MSQIISRIYPDPANAEAAVKGLRKAKFEERWINVVKPAEGNTDDDVLSRIRKGGVVASHADTYAPRIRQGETLVSVEAPFGCAGLATDILQRHSPADTGLSDQGYDNPPRDPAAPFSSRFGWGVLFHDPAPLSALFSLPVLSRRQNPKVTLVDSAAPFSHAVKAPVLTEEAAPLSSRAKWPTLLGDAAPLSHRLNVPVLSAEQQPPPARLGLPLLSENPAPLSSVTGLKVLSRDPAPLSRLLGLRVLSDDTKDKPG